MGEFGLSSEEIKAIVDHLSGRALISRRRDFERYTYGRGRTLHRHALLYRSLVREIERRTGKLKIEIVDGGSGEALIVMEDPGRNYRRETYAPVEVVRYLAERFPEIVPAPEPK